MLTHGTMPGARRRGRPRTAWMDNIKTWTGLETGRRMTTNLRSANDIILLATSEAELQELVNRLDRVSRKYSLLINVDNVPHSHSE